MDIFKYQTNQIQLMGVNHIAKSLHYTHLLLVADEKYNHTTAERQKYDFV